MSQVGKSAMIPMPECGEKITSAAARKRRERARRKNEGKAAVTVHVDVHHHHAVRTFEAILNSGDALAARMLRYLAILNDILPERCRARRRLPTVDPTEARAACAEIVQLFMSRMNSPASKEGNIRSGDE